MKRKLLTYGKHKYKYGLIKEDRKTLSLTIHPNLAIVVKSPSYALDEKVELFLKRKWLWLERKIRFFKKHVKTQAIKDYVSGESFHYLGKQYLLKVIFSDSNKISLSKRTIYLNTSGDARDSDNNRKLIEKWYKDQTKEVLNERFLENLKLFSLKHKPIMEIRKMKRRWGSYVNSKKIILNSELIKVSTDCIDYVIVHELCHLKHKNHSELYYKYLGIKCPNWKNIREKLGNAITWNINF
jgi:hypothetical protein